MLSSVVNVPQFSIVLARHADPGEREQIDPAVGSTSIFTARGERRERRAPALQRRPLRSTITLVEHDRMGEGDLILKKLLDRLS